MACVNSLAQTLTASLSKGNPCCSYQLTRCSKNVNLQAHNVLFPHSKLERRRLCTGFSQFSTEYRATPLRGVHKTELLVREVRCKAADESKGMQTSSGAGENNASAELDNKSKSADESLLSRGASVGILLFWAAFAGYAFLSSPNQVPFRDRYFVEKLVGLHADDGFQMNQVLICVFNIMGVIPLIYSQLLIPTGRSGKGSPPVWPFLTVSTAVGAFALLPYFALWAPGSPPLPDAEQGQSRVMRALNSKITAAIHVMSIDFMILTSFFPFWVSNDASVRRWAGGDALPLALSVIPVVGPAIYLLLRPPLPEADAKQE
eukprot:jgi/Mesen1/2641/ME000166S01762